MKKGIHPETIRDVIFLDTTSNTMFLVPSTIAATETATFTDGKEYPVVRVETSSASHPFYTGQEKIIDTAGRVEKFKARQAARSGATASK